MSARLLSGIGVLVIGAIALLGVLTHGDVHGDRAAAAAVAAPAPATTAPAVAAAPATTAQAATAATAPTAESASATVAGGVVTLAGVVPDAATHDAIVAAAVRAFGGADHVVDHLTVDAGAQPASWSGGFARVLAPLAQGISGASVTAAAGSITVTGTAPSAAAKQALLDAATAAAGTGVAVVDRVTVAPAAPAVVQASLDDVLRTANVQFETGSATLTPAGRATLDRVLPILRRAPKVRIQIAGYTDASGDPTANVDLSGRRAQTVRAYLVAHGIAAARLTARGFGQAHPVASNATATGRARNRRIEMHVLGGK